jgi:hypothetical protein
LSGSRTWLPGRRRAAIALAFIVAGCGQPAPTGTPGRLPSVTVSAAPTGGRVTPDLQATPPADPADAVVSTLVDHGLVPGSTSALHVTTDGTSIYFSGGSDATTSDYAPDLYRATPGGPAELIFDNPRRASNLIPVAAGGGYVAFGEENADVYGSRAWVLWLMAPGADEPIELERNPAGNDGPLPLVAVNDAHVVWQAIGFGPVLERAELVEVALPERARRVIRSADPQDYQWWDPALDADTLVYSEVDYLHGDAASLSKPAELYAMALDLSAPGAEPVRLDTSGRATEPAVRGSTVVWKEADNVFAWGTLSLLERDGDRDRDAPTMVVTSPQGAIKSPSVGNRFVGFWGIDDTEFVLYDLKTDAVADVFILDPASEIGGAFRVEVAGDLVVWVQGAEGGSVVAWGRLPTMDDP